jgi:DNA-binding MarR family transcriptional regulator
VPVSSPPELETAPRLRRVIARLYRRLRTTDASAAAGLSPSRASALLHTDRHGPVRLSELAESEGLNPTMLSRMVSGLTEAGLIERTSDSRDRRSAWVGVTPAGAVLAARMRHERTEAVTAALEELGPTEARKIELALPALELLAERLQEGRR